MVSMIKAWCWIMFLLMAATQMQGALRLAVEHMVSALAFWHPWLNAVFLAICCVCTIRRVPLFVENTNAILAATSSSLLASVVYALTYYPLVKGEL